MSGRSEFVAFVADEGNSPLAVLGAAISFVRVQGRNERLIADAADDAIKQELNRIMEAARREVPK